MTTSFTVSGGMRSQGAQTYVFLAAAATGFARVQDKLRGARLAEPVTKAKERNKADRARQYKLTRPTLQPPMRALRDPADGAIKGVVGELDRICLKTGDTSFARPVAYEDLVQHCIEAYVGYLVSGERESG